MLTIDEAQGRVIVCRDDGSMVEHRLDTAEAFEAVSAAWLRCGWDVKYTYGFTWMGRPVIQLPDDMIRIQEVIWHVRPDIIIETGIAHGGSLVFYASLFEAMGHGRVIGIDIDIRQHNRTAIEAHPLAKRITLIEGSSTAQGTLAAVRHGMAPGERALVVLDSNHTRAHVEAELEAYASLVAPGSYIVACDGIMALIAGAPRTAPDWTWNNPIAAVEAFLSRHPEFVLEEPDFPFNEGAVRKRVTYWPKSFLKRVDRIAA
jgi:cephalosporin hydroxylase